MRLFRWFIVIGVNNKYAALLATTDDAVAVAVRRVAAAADRPLDEAKAPIGRAQWDTGTFVMVDLAAASSAVAQRLPRRGGVVVVADGDASIAHWRVATELGAECVIALPADEADLVALLAHDAPERRGGTGGIVTVIGGCGGAGASTFAAALGLVDTGARRRLLLDTDAHGGGLDLVLGWEDRVGLRWPDLVLESGRVAADALHSALPTHGGLALVSISRTTPAEPTVSAASAVAEAGCDAGDLVVCDVPRRGGDVADMLIDRADLVAIVVPAQVRAVAAAQGISRRLAGSNANVGIVVRGPAPGGLTDGDVEDMLELPVLATMRPQRTLATMLDRGGLRLGRRSPLADAARRVLDRFDDRPVWSE